MYLVKFIYDYWLVKNGVFMTENVNIILRHHHRRTIIILLTLLVVFAIIFLVAFIGLQRKQSILGLGMPVEFENWLIMVLSLGSIIKIVWELYILNPKEQVS